MKKLNWNEINNYSANEIKTYYKLNDRQVEQGMRHHLNGANAKERRNAYEKFFGAKK